MTYSLEISYEIETKSLKFAIFAAKKKPPHPCGGLPTDHELTLLRSEFTVMGLYRQAQKSNKFPPVQ